MTTPLLIITRPIERCQKLLYFCQQNDFAYEISPLLKIEPINAVSGSLKTQIKNADILFFVSPTAVEICSQYIDLYEENKIFAAVGKGTEIALQKQKLSPILSPETGNDSEAVLKLPTWQNSTGNVLIIRGEKGREFLGDELRKMGWKVDYADIYRRIENPPPPEIWAKLNRHSGEIAVVLFSAQMCRLWLNNVPTRYAQKMKKLLYLTVHQRISDLLKLAGCERIITCANEQEMMKTLKNQWGKS